MREVVRAAVRVAGAVAEGVTIAEGAEDGHRAWVVAAGAAAALRVPGRVVVQWCREFHDRKILGSRARKGCIFWAAKFYRVTRQVDPSFLLSSKTKVP